ncbi:hypothetical protein NLN78_23455, partial [Citrobacter portucalensis]|uniref:hypothetical protein n=1 Tax=Citrobacter portucalensis TaxID=1639133 RepID=UPI00226A7F3C
TWDVTKNVSLTGGVDNVFDKRLWREGNAQTTSDIKTGDYMAGWEAWWPKCWQRPEWGQF